jgi:hypothetical protein
MITKSMPLKAKEKEEIHIDDDDVLLLHHSLGTAQNMEKR